MHGFEQYPQSYSHQYNFDQEDIKQEPYLSNMMDSYPPYEMFPEGQQQDFKYEMLRSMSQSMQQTHADAAPSLHSTASAPSVPSASSSTVGSPYSGHAQPVINQYVYPNQYINGPTILDDSSFQYYESAHFDPEAVISQDAKLNSSFVGKCADLSSFAGRSSTMPVQEFTPTLPRVPSPKAVVAAPSSASNAHPPNEQHRDLDGAAQITSFQSVAPQKPQSDSVFKSPTTPASAYPKATFPSPNARRTTCPAPFPSPQSPFHFSYPSPSLQPMQYSGTYPQYQFFSQTNGNSILPIEASCSSFLLP